MASVFKGAQIGGRIGEFLGPEGEVVGAGIGGLVGLGATIGRIIRNEPSTTEERRPLVPRNVFQTSPTGTSEIRQRRPTEPVGGRTQDEPEEKLHDVPLNEQQPRRPLQESIDNRNIAQKTATAVGIGTAIAGTAAVANMAGVPGENIKKSLPEKTVDTPTTIPPEVSTRPVVAGVAPPEKAFPDNPDNPLAGPSSVDPFTQEKIISPSSRKFINYRLPVGGRHDFIAWTKATENNTLASAY